MKNTSPLSSQDVGTLQMSATLVLSVLAVLGTLAALNGGTALTASSWDSMVTYLQGMLSSTWVLVLAFASLLVCVWQLMHGAGYRSAGLILAILGFALIGPGVVRAMATATGEPASITVAPTQIEYQK
ncbi:hypothetical protein B9Z44_14410 [Limnohabitans curvus]|uniref:Uncharacterized protein n=1 Tax=Limnohabitans curvus TaxID=323423 RepID=A0A315FT01_9BURK|nr:hypothetical protein [Limnohabitans curvus]PUE56437.1 hypothetical protein B9Z44_14410 [Limnohabitans curvus]